MRSYFVDFKKVYEGVLPHFLQRKGFLQWVTGGGAIWVTGPGNAFSTGQASKHLKWISVLLSPLRVLNDQLRAFVSTVRYEMYTNAQVVQLEHYLNDLYDPLDRRIYIEDGEAVDPLVLYRKDDVRSSFIIRRKGEGQASAVIYRKAQTFGEYDYVVVFPYESPIESRVLEIRKNIDKYNVAGMRYRLDFPGAIELPGG
jgi:hypothetical protein